MTLNPFFSLSANVPFHNSYNAASPGAAYAAAGLASYGGITYWFSPYRLSDQEADDEIVFAHDPVTLLDQSITSIQDDVRRHCALYINFTGFNVSTSNQYLVVLGLSGFQGSPLGGNTGLPTAQIFVNMSLVRTEELDGQEQIAVLMDCPGNAIPTIVLVRMASANTWARMHFKGVQGYVL